ncbi:MAG TPA: ATP-binding cassette domain-containing protein [Firmicutes bacterium]|jgi:putative ABC transport system ATP-binding protein|nr:ATP-binding cassette domain-containing protein [Bacillota bacterium]
MSVQLSIQHLSKCFEPNTPNRRVALDDLSLDVERGEFITILGSNGAGKSTLFNAILGKFLPDKGRIILDGDDITYWKDYKRAAHIGCLYQNPQWGTAPNMTIEENLALAYTRHASKSFFAVNRRDSAYFRELLATLGLGLENRMKTPMGMLSGGQRQAASLLMATIAKPKLLLLDEHTAALDPVTSRQVLKITAQIIAQNNLTALMITHDLHQAVSFGNRTIMLDAGRLVLDIGADERAGMTPRRLADLFAAKAKHLLSDRSLLSV